ncbi:MAG: carboxymuconolactone decarboxylase family protein [Candidatus Polarisedimenticolia bacterium]
MGRLTRLSPEQVGPEVRDLFRNFLEERGNIPNMFRTVAHRPDILATLLPHFRAVMAPGLVPVALKEMLAVRVSRLNGCHY